MAHARRRALVQYEAEARLRVFSQGHFMQDLTLAQLRLHNVTEIGCGVPGGRPAIFRLVVGLPERP